MAKAAQVHVLWIRLRSTDGTWIAPPDLRKRLVAEAKKTGTNLHDVAVGILAAEFRVPFEPSGRHTTPTGDDDAPLHLRVNSGLWRKLGAAAQGTRQRKALEVLSGHYGLLMPVRNGRVAA